MRLIRFALIALLAMTATAAAAEPSSYFVMRHLQKDSGEDPGLSAEGRRNAERLAGQFAAEGPTAIYVSTTRRARETAAPLAAKLGMKPKEYDPRDTPGLIAQVQAESGIVLIVGHSNTVPDIVELLGGERPAALLETDFGGIWHVAEGGKTEKKVLGE
jgi:phosphohistidine phosphatase SixA